MSPTSNCPESFRKLLQRFVTSKEPNKLRDTGTPYVDGQIHPQFINTSQKQTLPYLITIQVFDSICPNFPALSGFVLFIFSNKFTPEERREILEKDLWGRFKRSQSHNSPPASWAKSGSFARCDFWGKMIPIFNTRLAILGLYWSYNMFVFYC